MRRKRWIAGCIGIGLACGSFGLLRAQAPTEPLPARSGAVPKVYMPTISPMPGSPPPPPLPIVPAGGTNPGPLDRSITAGPPGSPPATPPARVLASVQAPSVYLEKRGAEVVTLGQPLSYEIVVRNLGPLPVQGVRVEDELPSGIRYVGGEPLADLAGNKLGWAIGSLEGHSERRIRVDLQAPGEGELRTCATVTFSTSATLKTRVVQPKVNLAIRGPENVAAGDPAPFQILISNPGSVPISGITLRGKLSDGLQHPQGNHIEAEIGNLMPGTSRTVTLTTTARSGGRQTCELTATANGGAEMAASAAVQVQEPAIQLRRIGPSRCYVKSEVGFQLEIANPSPNAVTNVTVRQTLPAGLEYVSATDDAAYDAATRTVTWRLPLCAAGSRRTVNYRAKATHIGEHPDRAIAVTERGGEVAADTIFTIEGIAAMSLMVVDLEDPVEVGGELTYEVRVVNQGSSPCTNIQITAQTPDGLQARDGTGPANVRISGTQVTFEPLARLATKADAVFRIKVRALEPGDYRFRVQMTCDQLKQPVTKEESSRVYKESP